jgi:hypothetical protein
LPIACLCLSAGPAPLPLVVPLRLLVVAWHRWAPPFVGCRLWSPSLSHLTCLTPSASQSVPLCFIATAPSPPTQSLVVVLPVCQPPPLSQRLCLSLRVVAWHCWAPPFVGCRLWPPSLSYLTRLHLLAAAAAGGCRQELLPPKPPPPAIVIAIPPSSPHCHRPWYIGGKVSR